MTKDELTITFLRECFELDAENGCLIWRTRPLHHFASERGRNVANSSHAGKRAGLVRETVPGYFREGTSISGVFVSTHRVIYALVHGLDLKDVPAIIDHRDGDSLNNRPDNLRAATQSQNICNSKKSASNKSGHKGVYFRSRDNLWHAQIGKDRKFIHLGRFTKKEDAAAAYRRAASELHGEFAKF
ncbi:HNH endonuclease protein [Rhizobium phage RHph_Y1_10]|nr:HNH endonuclease protein [Rhizobium phage RHph_Y1_10]